MSMYNEVLIGRMANSIRDRESVIMQSIFDFTPEFKTQTLTIPPISGSTQRVRTIEGGDVLIARDDILVIGNGARTSTQAIDMLINSLFTGKVKKHNILLCSNCLIHRNPSSIWIWYLPY